MYGELKILSGNGNPAFAVRLCDHLGVDPGRAKISRFSDGEINVEIDENIRGRDVFLVQSTSMPVNDHLMELLVMVDACKRASAGRITAVIPYYGYARQDRKVAPRAPITARMVADLLTAVGVHRVLTMDLHAGQIQGFFNIPVDNLYAKPRLVEGLKHDLVGGPSSVLVSPDAGGAERARSFAKVLDAEFAIIDKRRPAPNVVEVMNVVGEVTGKQAIIVDDMIDTAGTLRNAALALHRAGAARILAVATHAVLSGKAIANLTESPIERVLVTDTIPLREEATACPKIEVIGVAETFADAIKAIHFQDSVSRLFGSGGKR
ncbi:MAG: ribose-phosphate pyrophosphokinase [Deltaproteobacteria bacterium]|nr:ribose-phosphate pyrophosphokinase [Deltaproteobacteria bacterium]